MRVRCVTLLAGGELTAGRSVGTGLRAQADVCGNHSDIYGDDRLIPIDDLHQSLQDNLKFILSNLGCPGSYDLAAPRRTGRRRAEQEAPLAAVQSSLH